MQIGSCVFYEIVDDRKIVIRVDIRILRLEVGRVESGMVFLLQHVTLCKKMIIFARQGVVSSHRHCYRQPQTK